MAAQPSLTIGGLPPAAAFIGVENPVQLAGDSVSILQVSGCGARVEKRPGGYWSVYFNAVGTATFSLRTAGDSVLLALALPVKRVETEVVLKSTQGLIVPPGTISTTLLRELRGLDYRNNVPWLADATGIVGFTFAWVRQGEDPFEQTVREPDFTPEIRALLERCRPGDVIYLDDIRCRAPGDCSCTRSLENIRLEVR